MVIKSKDEMSSERSIDLTGPSGNAYCLLGIAKSYCNQLGDCKDWDKISAEMKSGDYENLVAVFDREFGSFVTLYR